MGVVPEREVKGRAIRFLHFPVNIANIPHYLAAGQRQLGYEADVLTLSRSQYGFQVDINLDLQSPIRVRDVLRLGMTTVRSLLRYDILISYFGQSLLPNMLDLRIAKALGKILVCYFCGCDVRDAKATVATYSTSACKTCWPNLCSPNRDEALTVARDYADKIFVVTPDLLEFVPRSEWMPSPIDTDVWKPVEREWKEGRPLRILHSPSSPQIKGTAHVIAAVETLKRCGVAVELDLLTGVPHEMIYRYMEQADIVVDQVLIGSYGSFAIEAMAAGKPVCCFIREDLLEYYPKGLPIVRTAPAELADALAWLAADRAQREAIGCAGRVYVLNHHERSRVAARFVTALGLTPGGGSSASTSTQLGAV